MIRPALLYEQECHNRFGFEHPTTSDRGLSRCYSNPQIVLNASMGYRAEYVLSRGELTGKEAQEEVSTAQNSAGGETVTNGDIARVVDQALTRRLGPLTEAVRRLEKQQERASLRDVLGGIGYIFGLMGLYYYFRSKS